jgi:hypothetical protein
MEQVEAAAAMPSPAAEEGVPPSTEAGGASISAWGADMMSAVSANSAASMVVTVSDPQVSGEVRKKMGRKKATVRLAAGLSPS